MLRRVLNNIAVRNALISRTYYATAILSVFPAIAEKKTGPRSNQEPHLSKLTSTLNFQRNMGGVQTVETDLPHSNSIQRPDKVKLSEEEWKKKLTSEQFHVCRRKGTEPAWTGDFLDNKEKGVYYCAACGADLFRSSAKFDSGSGWPSFFDVIRDKSTNIPAVEVHVDKTHGMERTEILCGRCDSHLGHVFNDGPKPTGLRFCVNGLSLKFRKEGNDEL